jgi:hypothetical protein
LHNSGSVIATCSGQRAQSAIEENIASSDEEEIGDDEEDESSDQFSIPRPERIDRIPDNSIKVWSL